MIKLKKTVANMVAPAARLYIRYSPISFLKPYLWDRVRWRSRQYVARTRFGALMAGNSLDLVQGYIYFFGIWEPNLTSFITRRLSGQVGRTFVDVGANVGYFSLLAAKQMASGNVVSIEAFPSIYSRLCKNVELNKFSNIRTIHCAAAENECEIEMFYAGPTNEGGTTSVPGKFATMAIRVTGRPLSELLTSTEVQSIRLIKIDVEGAEYYVAQGMRSMIGELQPDAEIVMEVTPAALGSDKMAELLKLFEDAGFFPYTLDNPYSATNYLRSRKVVRPQRLRSLPVVQTDMIFSRVDSSYL